MKKVLILLLALGIVLPVYAKKHTSEEIITPSTQLEKRTFQTQTYNNIDQNKILKTVLNVLQDEGYLVYNVNSLLGFIYAVKDFDTTDPNIDISKEFGFTKSRLNYNGVKVATLETAVNVTSYGDLVKIRINFKRKLLNQYGNAQFIDDVSDKEFYKNFYDKLDTALSIDKKVNENTQETEDSDKSDSTSVIMPELLQEIHGEVEKLINIDRNSLPEINVQSNEEKSDKSVNDEELNQTEPQEQTVQEETDNNIDNDVSDDEVPEVKEESDTVEQEDESAE